MKQVGIIILSAMFALTTNAQSKAKPKTTARKTATAKPTAVVLKTLADSASYAIGQNIAQSLSSDLENIKKDIFIKAIQSVFKGEALRFSEEEVRSVITQFTSQEEKQKAQQTINEGQTFLNKNKNNPKITTTASGLQYEVLQAGTGVKPTVADTVVCNYIGRLTDSTEFDNSYERGEPLTIPLGGVIQGWIEGLQLMPVGSKYRFYIPNELGYGMRPAGTIPAGSVLIFDIELLDVKKRN